MVGSEPENGSPKALRTRGPGMIEALSAQGPGRIEALSAQGPGKIEAVSAPGPGMIETADLRRLLTEQVEMRRRAEEQLGWTQGQLALLHEKMLCLIELRGLAHQEMQKRSKRRLPCCSFFRCFRAHGGCEEVQKIDGEEPVLPCTTMVPEESNVPQPMRPNLLIGSVAMLPAMPKNVDDSCKLRDQLRIAQESCQREAAQKAEIARRVAELEQKLRESHAAVVDMAQTSSQHTPSLVRPASAERAAGARPLSATVRPGSAESRRQSLSVLQATLDSRLDDNDSLPSEASIASVSELSPDPQHDSGCPPLSNVRSDDFCHVTSTSSAMQGRGKDANDREFIANLSGFGATVCGRSSPLASPGSRLDSWISAELDDDDSDASLVLEQEEVNPKADFSAASSSVPTTKTPESRPRAGSAASSEQRSYSCDDASVDTDPEIEDVTDAITAGQHATFEVIQIPKPQIDAVSVASDSGGAASDECASTCKPASIEISQKKITEASAADCNRATNESTGKKVVASSSQVQRQVELPLPQDVGQGASDGADGHGTTASATSLERSMVEAAPKAGKDPDFAIQKKVA